MAENTPRQLTVPIVCPRCNIELDVPVNIVSAKESAAYQGNALVTVEADPMFLADHEASHITATTLANVAPTLLPPKVI